MPAPSPAAEAAGPGGTTRRRVRLLAALVLAVGLGLGLAGPGVAADAGSVVVVDVSGEIDLGLAPFLDRVLAEAADAGAPAVIVRIDTPGGRLDAVLEMRDSLLAAPVRSIAFVDRTAFSAGALVALASEDIYMAPGGVVGAATPVTGEGMPADEKVVSAVRSTFRATAEERGRDPRVAEAMVDPAVEVEGLVGRGELLTLTTPEAVEWGFADGVAADLEEVLAAAGLEGSDLVRVEPGLAERLVRFITNPVLASLLMLIGVWLVVGDLLSGGAGIGVVVGASLLGLFFWGHLLAGLAGWEDVALVVLGIVLLLVEAFVIPGFGIAGLLGLVALAGGTFLAMLNRDFDFVPASRFASTGALVAFIFLGALAGIVGMLAFLSRRGGPEGVVLRTRLGTGVPVTERSSAGWLRWFGDGGVLAGHRPERAASGVADTGDAGADAGGEGGDEKRPRQARDEDGGQQDLRGATGVASSDLRPAGVADIDGRRVDVVTEGEYLSAGDEVEVVLDEGYRRVVRRRRT